MSSQRSTSPTTIRHSGRCLIRGKIRRVWRERSLSLTDAGTLRYYDTDTHQKYTLHVQSARILDPTTFRDLHVGLPISTYGFVMHASRMDREARDFLCAVPTLEEAQMWVVALQWASRQNPSYLSTSSLDDFHTVERQEVIESQRSMSQSVESISKSAQQSQPPRAGRIVVTKAVQYRIVQFVTVAIEIHVLLLIPNQTNAEELVLLRTAADVEALVRDVTAELGAGVVEHALGSAQSKSLAQAVAPQLLPMVDMIVRNLVINVHTVNAVALKRFLGLSSKASKQNMSHRWWTKHMSRSIAKQQTIRLRDGESSDNFVKEWLRKCSKIPQCNMDQHILSCVTGLKSYGWCVLPLATSAFVWRMPTVELRMDVLALTWIGAGYAGMRYGSHLQQQKPKKKVRAVPLPTQRSKETLGLASEEEGVLVSPPPRHEYTQQSSMTLDDSDGEDEDHDASAMPTHHLSSPLPKYPSNNVVSCWSQPDATIFHVRGSNYLKDRIKVPSGAPPLTCRGVDVWMTDNPERNIARHPDVLGGKLAEKDTFLVNFLLPFGNFVAYFDIPPLSKFPAKLANVWTKFRRGDQEYRDARLKLLPVVVEGPWIVKAAVGPGKSPALLGKVIPLQYFFREPSAQSKGVFEVDVIITASTIAKGILSVVKGHTSAISIAFAFIIEGTNGEELPENVLCCFQMHSLRLEDCPVLPSCLLDDTVTDD